MEHSWTFWIGFNVFFLSLLCIDLFFFSRKEHIPTMKEATCLSAFWISLAFMFNIWIYFAWGLEPALKFLAGYLLEESLSVDNLFVFLMIFSYFRVPESSQRHVLFWGILAAIVFRLVFIILGVAFVSRFQWALPLFGFFLLYTSYKMFRHHGTEVHPEKNPVIKLFSKFFPITKEYHGNHFFVKQNKIWYATPLFVALLAVETADIVFAIDSIPAIFGITLDPFIIYSSNVFAILGLRSLFFVLAGAMKLFRFLPYALAIILGFIGLKMVFSPWFHLPIVFALSFIIITLVGSIVASKIVK